MDFIPAKESPLFTRIFSVYVRFLFWRRFKRIWIRRDYHPSPGSRTVYYLNHHSWWDGLIPLLLNESLLNQKARALMEDKQMARYPFFKKIGAFSINREDPAKVLRSLRYAVKSMNRDRASLFIYPEGQITPAGSSLSFEGGLSWIHARISGVDFVPIGIYIHTIRQDKPELHLHIGKAVSLPPKSGRDEKTRIFEQRLEEILEDLRNKGGFDDSDYERLRLWG